MTPALPVNINFDINEFFNNVLTIIDRLKKSKAKKDKIDKVIKALSKATHSTSIHITKLNKKPGRVKRNKKLSGYWDDVAVLLRQVHHSLYELILEYSDFWLFNESWDASSYDEAIKLLRAIRKSMREL